MYKTLNVGTLLNIEDTETLITGFLLKKIYIKRF